MERIRHARRVPQRPEAPMTTPAQRAASPQAPAAFRVAVAQIAPALGNVAANLQLHREQIARARDSGADLIVFPELSLTGYYLRDQVPEIAEPAGGPSTQALMEAAGSMALVFGFVEEGHGYRFYNAGAFCD